ncbi:O-glucosyltransferase rumi-like isoform X1 [Panicum miliaceum]|uniref:O-glucosyltransferase rumi-like isoform X1 n=1 Tax=Panicum miliaceum TaxID=4540 RepID=A0A3L6PUB3_PANMI|nr:O-glucosyltransferase rumi-like isoform X1 [Panicum miliaceum]
MAAGLRQGDMSARQGRPGKRRRSTVGALATAENLTQEMAASLSGLGEGAAARIQGVRPVQAVHAQAQLHCHGATPCHILYKIYIEGRGWSVSEKYILACDSVALMVRPRLHDFFSRGLAPLRYYWPVRDRGVAMCRSIKFAVDWGNAHPDKAREIGRNASRFVREDLTMGHVYDYMLHLLTEYARLLRYRPAVPRGAAEGTVESMARGGGGPRGSS